MTYSKQVYSGKFIPRNPEKYKGSVNNIIYRSSYELKFMNWCDISDSVLQWGSEEVVIPYISPLDNKIHRYFVDFFVKVNSKNKVRYCLVEVKPFRFTQEPKIPKRKTKRFLNEVKQWGVNLSKWEAAKEFCLDRNWEFMIITEKELGI
jgi:hypothetical protein|tara:strand:+ start:58 stop:504 length:447 start_codon:yes stop_codon:yes gene_type:complete